jgi:hypothetical protein
MTEAHDDHGDHGDTLDRFIHDPARFMIVALLYSVERADFLYLQRETGLTKGNLSAHPSKPEQSRYVRIEKTFRSKMPLTACSVTAEGRQAFEQYRTRLQ